MQSVGVVSSVDEDDGLRHLTDAENFLEELRFFALLAAELVLFDMIVRQLLLRHLDLMGFLHKVLDLCLDILTVSSGEKDVLHFVGQLGDVLGPDLFELGQLTWLSEKDISLVDYEAAQTAQVHLLLAALFQVVGELAKRCHKDVLVVIGTRHCKVRHVDVGVFAQLGVDVGDLG